MTHTVRTVLVVDDDTLDLKMIERCFHDLGDTTEIRTCLGSETAIDAMIACKPDLVLLDISMPGLNGFEVQDRARRQLTNAPIVVMLSSSEDPKDIGRAYDTGAAAYVVKPTSLAGYRSLASAISAFWTNRVVRLD